MSSTGSESFSDIFSGMGYWSSECEILDSPKYSGSTRLSSESSIYFLFPPSENEMVQYSSTDSSMYVESSSSEENITSTDYLSDISLVDLPSAENTVVKYSSTRNNRKATLPYDAPTLDDLYNFLLQFPYVLDVANAWTIIYAILLNRIILNKPVPKYCFFQLHTLIQKYLAETQQKLMEPPERYGEYLDKYLSWDAYTIITQELRFASFVQISVAFCKIEFYNGYIYCFEVFGDSIFHAEYLAINRILMAHKLEHYEDVKVVTMFLPMSPCPRCCGFLENLIKNPEMGKLLHVYIKVGALYRHYHKLCRSNLKKLTDCPKIHVNLISDIDRQELHGYLYPENTRLRSLRRCSKL